MDNDEDFDPFKYTSAKFFFDIGGVLVAIYISPGTYWRLQKICERGGLDPYELAKRAFESRCEFTEKALLLYLAEKFPS